MAPRFIRCIVLAIVFGGTVALTLVAWSRIARISRASAAIARQAQDYKIDVENARPLGPPVRHGLAA